MMTQGTQKADNRTDSRNADSRNKAVTTSWMGRRGLLQLLLSVNNIRLVSVDLRGLSTTTSLFPQVQFSSSFNIIVFYISSIQYMSIKEIEPHVFSQLGFKKTPFLPFLNTGFKVGGDNSLPNYSLHTSYTCFEVLQSKRHSILKKFIYILFFKNRL